jgi:hypothetical protein
MTAVGFTVGGLRLAVCSLRFSAQRHLSFGFASLKKLSFAHKPETENVKAETGSAICVSGEDCRERPTANRKLPTANR